MGARLRAGRGSHALRSVWRSGRASGVPARPHSLCHAGGDRGDRGCARGSCPSGFRRRGEDRGSAQIPGVAGVSETQGSGPLAGRVRAAVCLALESDVSVFRAWGGDLMEGLQYEGGWVYQRDIAETVGWFVGRALPDAAEGWQARPWRIAESGRPWRRRPTRRARRRRTPPRPTCCRCRHRARLVSRRRSLRSPCLPPIRRCAPASSPRGPTTILGAGWAGPSEPAPRADTGPAVAPMANPPMSHAAAVRAGAWPARRPRGSVSTKTALGEGCPAPPCRALSARRYAPSARILQSLGTR